MNKTVFVCEERQSIRGVITAGYCRFDGDGEGEYTSRATKDHRVIYLERGWLKFIKNGKEVLHAEAPSIIYTTPESRDGTVCSDNCHDFWVSFGGITEIITDLPTADCGIAEVKCHASGEIIRARIESIIGELRLKEPGYAISAEASLMKLLLLFYRSQSDSGAVRESAKKKLAPALLIMNEEISENYSMDYYAKKCHMSKSSFLHTFSRVMGTTPVKYINEIKIRHAERMLLETDMQIAEISSALGFSSPQYFSKTFYNYSGYRPRDYRRENNQLPTDD